MIDKCDNRKNCTEYTVKELLDQLCADETWEPDQEVRNSVVDALLIKVIIAK